MNTTLSTAWGGRYVNDFIDQGRVKRVYVQGDAPYRADPQSLGQWYVRSSTGEMAPFSVLRAHRLGDHAEQPARRFQGVPSFEFQGQAAPGVSSGEAMDEMEKLWPPRSPAPASRGRGQSYQERLSSGQAPLLYALSLLVVFLCLAALYESWSIPVAVLLVIPLGLVGAIFAVTLRGLQNDVYLQIGLLTTMGLAAKNAILMIEFAEQAEKKGARVIDAALEAARIRLRPILMTSFSFIFGVLPLAISTGAGANSRIAIGTSVIGGMLTATHPRDLLHPAVLRPGPPQRPRRHHAAHHATRIRRRREAARMRRGAALLALLADAAAPSMEPQSRGARPGGAAVLAGRRRLSRPERSALPASPISDIFRDPRLQTLIAQALVNNRDLMIAAANIAAAREQYHIQRAQLFPQVDASAASP